MSLIPQRRAVVGPLTHPVTATTALLAAAAALLAAHLTSGVPVVLAWVVLALSAGYAISGSV